MIIERKHDCLAATSRSHVIGIACFLLLIQQMEVTKQGMEPFDNVQGRPVMVFEFYPDLRVPPQWRTKPFLREHYGLPSQLPFRFAPNVPCMMITTLRIPLASFKPSLLGLITGL